MSVHDLICFVQRNDQCCYPVNSGNYSDLALDLDQDDSSICLQGCYLHCAEDHNPGMDVAILVQVPLAYSRDEIGQWPLQQFAEFPRESAEYCCDKWGFPSLDQSSDEKDAYATALCASTWLEQTIWQHPARPDVWLVTFAHDAFTCFVLEIDQEEISCTYLRKVMVNRGINAASRDTASRDAASRDDAISIIMSNIVV